MNRTQHTALMETHKTQTPQRNKHLIDGGVGYYRIPDFEKYKSWSWKILNEEVAGNCFFTNWDKYQELKERGASVKLVVGMVNGITHAFIIDGADRYDFSQFREIKEPMEDYLAVNQFTRHSFYTGDNWVEWESLCRLAGQGVYKRGGQIRIDVMEGTMYKAMKSIINL